MTPMHSQSLTDDNEFFELLKASPSSTVSNPTLAIAYYFICLIGKIIIAENSVN